MIVSAAATLGALVVLVSFLIRPPVGFAALVCFYPFIQFVPTGPIAGVNAETVLGLVVVGMMLLHFGPRVPPLRLTGPVIAYGAVLVLGGAVTASWYTDWFPRHTNWDNLKLIKGLLFASLFFFASYWWFPNARERRRLLEVFSLAITAVSCVGILDFIVPVGLGASGVEGRATGVLGDPNVLAGYLAVSSIVPLYLARMRELSATRRALHLSAYGLAAVTIVLTLSRGGWLAMVVGHSVFFALTDRRLLVLGVAVLFVAATIAYPLLPGMVRERIEATLQPGQVVYQGQLASRVEASAGQRVTLWRVGFEIFQESPLWGRGLESVRILSPQYGAKYGLVQHRPPHNLFVKIIAEMGLIGFTVFSWLAITVLLYGWRLWRSESEERGLGALFIASGAAFATSNLFAIVAFKSAVAICIWILIGLVGRASEPGGPTTLAPGRSVS